MKEIIIIGVLIFILGCGEESKNSDGSNKTTYTSCSITESKAILATDRAKDVSQCWGGVNYKEESLAMDWCKKHVNSYMGRYVFGHDVEFKVASTNCPQVSNNTNSEVKYSIKVTLEKTKSNGSAWDIFNGRPDIQIYIDDNYQGLCRDTFECVTEFTSRKTNLYFKIYDKDKSSNDFVGKGSCQINETCEIGQSIVEINAI